jgi:hypothetical protein
MTHASYPLSRNGLGSVASTPPSKGGSHGPRSVYV